MDAVDAVLNFEDLEAVLNFYETAALVVMGLSRLARGNDEVRAFFTTRDAVGNA